MADVHSAHTVQGYSCKQGRRGVLTMHENHQHQGHLEVPRVSQGSKGRASVGGFSGKPASREAEEGCLLPRRTALTAATCPWPQRPVSRAQPRFPVLTTCRNRSQYQSPAKLQFEAPGARTTAAMFVCLLGAHVLCWSSPRAFSSSQNAPICR